eukprot:COSAG01_NODE_14258_length_1476_cov_4.254902_2_plen_39_part_00
MIILAVAHAGQGKLAMVTLRDEILSEPAVSVLESVYID